MLKRQTLEKIAKNVYKTYIMCVGGVRNLQFMSINDLSLITYTHPATVYTA